MSSNKVNPDDPSEIDRFFSKLLEIPKLFASLMVPFIPMLCISLTVTTLREWVRAVLSEVGPKNFSSKLKLHQTVENKPINNAGWYNYNFISTLVAIRITLSVLIVSIINWYFNITDINLQALITTIVVTSQRSTQNFNRKIWNRLLGILIGCVLAIIYAKICIYFKQQWLLVVLLTICFTISTFIDKKIKYAKYIILQAVIMIPIISLTDSHSWLNSKLLYERSLGSIEGAIIAIIIFYIIHIFGKNIKN